MNRPDTISTAPAPLRGPTDSPRRSDRRVALRVAGRIVVCAFLLAAATYLVPRTYTLDVGGGRDGAFITGFYGAGLHGDVWARWTHGAAVIRLSDVEPLPGLVRMRLAGHSQREPDVVQIIVGDLEAHSVALEPVWQTLELRIGRSGTPPTIRIHSGTTEDEREGGAVGVLIDRIDVRTGGFPALSALLAPRLIWTVLLFAALLIVSQTATRQMPTPASAAVSLSAALAALAALVHLRPLIDSFLPFTTLVVVLAALVVLAARDERAGLWTAPLDRRVVDWRARSRVFLGLAVLLVAALFEEALTKGYVLSQADILFRFPPWSMHRLDGWLQPGNPLLADVPMQFYPFLVHAAEAVRNLDLPLWTTSIYGGHPFLASFQSAVFSPFTLLAYVVPLPFATVPVNAARLLVGGLGMFVFIRSLGLSWPAATFAGIAYLLNPFSIVWLEHPHAAAAAWLPWVLWATHRAVVCGRGRDAALLAACMAMLLLAGHPETAFKVVMLTAPYGLLQAYRARNRWRALLNLCLGGGLGVLLSAVQLLPFLEYLPESRIYVARSGYEVNPFFAPWQTFVTAFVPRFFGSPIDEAAISPENRLGVAANYNEQQIYAGMATWVLAAVGLVAGWRSSRCRFFAAAGLVAGLLMYGVPIVHPIAGQLPMLRLAALSRFGLITITCAIVLAAVGVEALLRRPRELPDERRRGAADASPASASLEPAQGSWQPAAFAMLFVSVIVLMWLLGERSTLEPVGWWVQATLYSAAAVALGLATLGAVMWRVQGRSPAVFVAMILALLGGDLLYFGRGVHPLMPAEHVFPEVPSIALVRADHGLYRVAGWEDALVPNSAMVYGLQDVRGYDGMGPRRYVELLDTVLEPDDVFIRSGLASASPLLDLLNVKYVFAPPGMRPPIQGLTGIDEESASLYRNDDALPRAFLVDAYRVEEDAEILRLLRGGAIDFRRTVLLEREPEQPFGTVQAGMASPGEAIVTQYQNHVVEIETVSDGARLLVLTDAYYPGWRAMVNGGPVRIARANYAFRAVPVPAGRSVVRFEYRPLSFTIGLLVSVAALLIVIGMVVRKPGEIA
jgi:hypothetical protein